MRLKFFYLVSFHLQNIRVRANFGGRAFAYAEGQEHRNAADDCHDAIQDMREGFGALPFNMGSDSDSDAASLHSATSDLGRDVHSPPGPPCRTPAIPKSLKGIWHCIKIKVICVFYIKFCHKLFALRLP